MINIKLKPINKFSFLLPSELRKETKSEEYSRMHVLLDKDIVQSLKTISHLTSCSISCIINGIISQILDNEEFEESVKEECKDEND